MALTPAIKKPDHHPLKRWRFENGFTLKDLARRLQCTNGYLSQIENRQKEPSLSFANEIVKIAGGALQLSDFLAAERK